MEEIIQIPDGWDANNISNLCDIVDYRGKTPKKVERGTFLVTAKNIRNGKIDYNISKEYVKTEEYQEIMSRGTPKIGDVLITTEAPLGEVASIDIDTVALAQRVIKLRGKKGNLENKYLKYYLLSKEFQKEIRNDATGSTVEGIKGSRLKKKIIKYPKDTKEQLIIVDILEKLDQNIEKTTEAIAKYKQVKKGLMADLLTGKIRIKGGKWVKETEFINVDGIGNIPKEWEANSIDYYKIKIIDGDRGSNYPNGNDFSRSGFCIFLNNKNIDNGKILYDNCDYITIQKDQQLRKGKLAKGDIVITTRGTVGNIALYKEKDNYPNVRINSGMIILREYEKSFNDKYFINYWKYIYPKVQVVIGSGSAQPQLPIKDIKTIKLVRPNLFEQIEISNVLEKQDHLIEKEEQYLEKLQKLKSGLMEDLLTGRKRVNID